MKKLLSILLGLTLLAACAAPQAETPETKEPVPVETNRPETTSSEDIASSVAVGSLSPVETRQPETNYLPAFEGQTRINGTKTEAELKTVLVTDQLESPWGIVAASDGRFFITERMGSLRIVTPTGEVSQPIMGFPELNTLGQGGLLDLALSPDFETDRQIYFTFSEQTKDGSATAVGHGRLSNDESSLEDFQIIFRALPYYTSAGHFGSRLIFDAKGNLFVTTGDRQDASQRMKVQELDNGYGKVLHITNDGAPVENHFQDQPGAWPEVYSYGHRNIQGIAIHPETQDVWVSEMGPRGGDELNLILPGRNYGWPLVSYGIEYSGEKIGEGITQMEGTEQPVYYWDPVLAPAGMVFYDSPVIEEWKNSLFIAGLRGSHIARIVLNEQTVVAEERLLADLGERFRDLSVGLDGALYTITDSGKLYRLGVD